MKNPDFELLSIHETATYEEQYYDTAAAAYNKTIIRIRRPLTRYEKFKYDAQQSKAFKSNYKHLKSLYRDIFKRDCQDPLPEFPTRWPQLEGETVAEYNKRVINMNKELKEEHDALVRSWRLDMFSLEMVTENTDVSDD